MDNSRWETRLASACASWPRLKELQEKLAGQSIVGLFEHQPDRVERMTAQACGLLLDYSKHRVTGEVMDALQALGREQGLETWRARLFAGAAVNPTEGRAALHMALRSGAERFPESGAPHPDVMPEVRAVTARLADFTDRVRSGAWKGFDGRVIRDVVNIGIGGSDLGPAMALNALCDGAGDSDLERSEQGPRVHFVSNIDSTQLARTLLDCEAATTLFIVASKSFSTQETLYNANSARRWLVAASGDEQAVSRHFVALSTQLDKTRAFGIDDANVFEFWDWVGGRYSIWSAIGVSIGLGAGWDSFERFLAGGASMDEHFRNAPADENLPVILALLGVWYRCFWGASTHAVLAYDYALGRFPDYLQQLEMESNGKGVSRDGQVLDYPTCPIVWGGLGNNGQHAFYQLLHQTPELVPTDFIVAARPRVEWPGHQDACLANALAQSEVLMRGRNAEEARRELQAQGLDAEAVLAALPHRLMPGNKPSSFLLYETLTPEVLGALVALYEHKVFVQSVIWGINPFDQFGVELGKTVARSIESLLGEGGAPEQGMKEHDPSTAALIARLRALRNA